MDIERFYTLLSEYFDEELEAGLCRDIEELISSDSCCEAVFNTFSRTLELCEEIQIEETDVPEEVHISLYKSLRIEVKRGCPDRLA